MIADEGNTAPVYNFEVDGFHTYYVGKSGVWVHNDGCRGIIRNYQAGEAFERWCWPNWGYPARIEYPCLRSLEQLLDNWQT